MTRPRVTAKDMAVLVSGDLGDEAVPISAGNPIPVSVIAGGGGGTEYTEDAAAEANPVGKALIAVRRDTLTTAEVSADGDNVALKANSRGQLHVDAGGGVASGGADSGNPVKVGGRHNAAAPVLADGQRGDLQLDASANLKTIIVADGQPVSDASPLPVEVIAGGGGGTEYTEDAAAEANPVGKALIAVRRDTLTTAEVSADGDNVALKANSRGQLHVDAAGGVASGGADSGNPVKVGGRYNAAAPALADGQRGDLQLDASANLKTITVCGTGVKSAVASGVASVNILAANAARKGATITNTDANTLYLDLSGGVASATSHTVQVPTGGYYEVPFGYTGLITGIWAADGAGSALVTEFS